MKTKIQNQLRYLVILSILITFIFLLSSCKKDDTITNEIVDPNSSCGVGATKDSTMLASHYTNTFMGGPIGETRTFQFSAGGINNVCARSKPTFSWHAAYLKDNTRKFTLKGVSRWSVFGTDDPGNYDSTSFATAINWTANAVVGLEQAFPTGPANFYDMRIDITFTTLGSLDADKNYLNSRFPTSSSIPILYIRFVYEKHPGTLAELNLNYGRDEALQTAMKKINFAEFLKPDNSAGMLIEGKFFKLKS